MIEISDYIKTIKPVEAEFILNNGKFSASILELCIYDLILNKHLLLYEKKWGYSLKVNKENTVKIKKYEQLLLNELNKSFLEIDVDSYVRHFLNKPNIKLFLILIGDYTPLIENNILYFFKGKYENKKNKHLIELIKNEIENQEKLFKNNLDIESLYDYLKKYRSSFLNWDKYYLVIKTIRNNFIFFNNLELVKKNHTFFNSFDDFKPYLRNCIHKSINNKIDFYIGKDVGYQGI